MKKIITIIAALTLTLVSCKKESVLVEKTIVSEKNCKLLQIEIDNEFTTDDIDFYIWKNNIICSKTEIFKVGDVLEVRVVNRYVGIQNISIKVDIDNIHNEYVEGDIEPGNGNSLEMYYVVK
tara:strand:+ start:178 stop:543 length:366 start_codon:yes stop_codon:yes gene_type:complete